MTTISLAQAKNQLSELVERARSGEAITVTRRGQPVARLVPANPEEVRDQRAEVQDVIEQLRRLSQDVHLEGDLKALARAGLD